MQKTMTLQKTYTQSPHHIIHASEIKQCDTGEQQFATLQDWDTSPVPSSVAALAEALHSDTVANLQPHTALA